VTPRTCERPVITRPSRTSPPRKAPLLRSQGTAKHATVNDALDLDALADKVLEKIVARIAGAAKPATYSDRRGHGPAGMTDDRAKQLIRACPHSVKRGRWCVVDREVFERWERSLLPAVEAPVAVSDEPVMTFEIAARRAGMRLVSK